MSRQTTNYGLTKPDYTDIADIEVVNANMDIIDGALKVIDTKSNNVMSKHSSAWSSTVTYAVGQYCVYNNSLWKSLVQHSGQTPQEGTYWARVSLDTLGSEINALNSNLDTLNTAVKGKQTALKIWTTTFTNVTLKAGTYVKLGTAPSGIRPANMISIFPYMFGNVPASVVVELEIDGNIYAWSSDASAGNSSMSIKIVYV